MQQSDAVPRHGGERGDRLGLQLAQISRFSGVTFESLVFAGGGAKGALWSQILSDVTGLPVRVPEVKEATALGCALPQELARGCLRIWLRRASGW